MNILYIPFYTEQNIQRKRELDECLAANIMNKSIHKIVLIADETVGANVSFPFEKVEIYHLKHRPTFADIFYQVIPRYSDDDDINLVSNSDIYFENLKQLNHIDWDKGVVLALSRHNNINGHWTLQEGMDSQDVWVFKGHPKGMFCNFPIGCWGSDNRIAYELDKAGYWVFDLASEIICKHIHSDSLRKPRKDTDFTVQPPYKLIPKANFYHIKTKPVIKIGHIGMDAFFGAEGAAGDTLQECGEYKFLDWLKFTDAPHRYEIKDRAKFEEACINLSRWADFVFIQTQTEGVITPDLMNKISEGGRKPTVSWTGDKRDTVPQWMIECAPYCISVFSNADDVETMKKMGFKSAYMNSIFSPTKYNPKGYIETVAPIIFMGNNYWNKEKKQHQFPLGKERQDLTLYLIESYGKDFALFGIGWDGLENGILMDDPIREANIYRGAKIGINYSHFDSSRYSSDRMFRIMGCGILCLTHHYKDIEVDFEVGKHLVTFHTLEEMKEKIDYYLEHEDERKKIAEEGCKYVHKNYGTSKLYSTILKLR